MLPVDNGAFVDIVFVATVVTLMLYPWAGRRTYLAYRTPVFIAGVVFMPLFLYVGAVLSSGIEPVWTQTVLLLVGLGAFWLSAAVLALPQVHGEYVTGLAFRPDVILPGGVNLVKGIILTGLGLMLSFQPEYRLPAWNWWGFSLAFWGIITIIPLRGMLKMLMRRGRLLGEPWATSWWAVAIREHVLFAGLLVLMYGFLNAFMGTLPFTDLLVRNWSGWVVVAGGYLVLVPLRGWFKRAIREGEERWWQTLAKQVLLYAGTGAVIYGYIWSFMGTTLTMRPATNPAGFGIGVGLIAAGFVLAVPVRAAALRNEWAAAVRIVIGRVCDLDEGRRREFIARRVAVLADQPEGQRRGNMRRMLEGLVRAGEERRLRFLGTMVALLGELPTDRRETLMRSNAACLAELPDGARAEVMRAMMASLAGLPEETRQSVMQTMAGIVSA